MICALPLLFLVAQAAGGTKPKPATPAPKPQAATSAQLQDQATKARLAGRLDEAVATYKRALQANPAWGEGWYFLGTIQYERDQGRDCALSFSRFSALQPNVAAGHVMLGLCLFQATDYARSLASLLRAEKLGWPKAEDLADAARYHLILLYTRAGNFEKALEICTIFAQRVNFDPKIVEAAGIAALRREIFPTDLPSDDRDLVYRTGRAVLTMTARRAAEASRLFDDLIRDYPKAPNLHYVYGSILTLADPEMGLQTLVKELNVQPDHLPTLIVMGLEYIRLNRFPEARDFGERAAKAAPNNFTAHTLLGRALAEGEIDLPRGIRELELALQLEAGSPQVRIALASAYAKAGRREDAAKQRAEFLRLKKSLEGGAQ
jgi:tetratricopeptide (TPR) repeat protein